MLKVYFIGRNPRRTLLRTVLWVVLCVVIFRFILPPIKVKGTSMDPTFKDGSYHLTETLTYLIRNPAPRDIIAIEMAGRHTMYLKRILGAPGDELWFENGTLYRNDEAVPEEYVVYQGNWTTPKVKLNVDEYFVAGDYRVIPWEWHAMGVVDRERIAGKVLF